MGLMPSERSAVAGKLRGPDDRADAKGELGTAPASRNNGSDRQGIVKSCWNRHCEPEIFVERLVGEETGGPFLGKT
jgi:hypothetical protein